MNVVSNGVTRCDETSVFGFRKVEATEWEFVDTFPDLQSLIDERNIDDFVVKIVDKKKRINVAMVSHHYFSASTRGKHPSLSGIKKMLREDAE